MNLPCTDALGVERDNLVLDADDARLILLHHDGLELAEAVLGNGNLLLSVLTGYRLLALAITAIRRLLVLHIIPLIAQMRVHFCYFHFSRFESLHKVFYRLGKSSAVAKERTATRI